MQLDAITAAPRTIILGGREYRVSTIRPRDLGELQAWIKDHVPRPLAAVRAHLPGLEPEDRKVLLELAYADEKRWPPSIDDEAGWRLMTEGPGRATFIGAILRRHQPGLPAAEVDELAGSIDAAEFAGLLALAFGKDPGAGATDPKAATTATTTASPSPSPSPSTGPGPSPG